MVLSGENQFKGIENDKRGKGRRCKKEKKKMEEKGGWELETSNILLS